MVSHIVCVLCCVRGACTYAYTERPVSTRARTLKVGEAIVSVSVSAGVVASIALMVLAWSVTIVLPIILRARGDSRHRGREDIRTEYGRNKEGIRRNTEGIREVRQRRYGGGSGGSCTEGVARRGLAGLEWGDGAAPECGQGGLEGCLHMIVSPTLRPAISRMLPSPSFVTTTPAQACGRRITLRVGPRVGSRVVRRLLEGAVCPPHC